MRRLFILAAAGLLVATAAVTIPAVAADSGYRYLKWRQCPAGTADAGAVAVEPTPRGRVVFVSGWVEPCQDPGPNSEYAVMAYGADRSVAMLTHFRYRPDSVSRNGFRYPVTLPSWVAAVCLVTFNDARPACQSVTVTGTDTDTRTRVGGPLPTDDPLVNITLTRMQTRYEVEVDGDSDPCPECYMETKVPVVPAGGN